MIAALSGGIGGAKLALGLSRVLPPGELTVIANVGDDFEHLGLAISPDIDTLTYTLAGLDNPDLGWGRRDETWSFMETLEALGGEAWFRLGDRDLALHVARTQRLRGGEALSTVAADTCRRLGIASKILPATDNILRTQVLTDDGWMDFQPWFVGRHAQPAVHEIRFAGAETARAAPGVLDALDRADGVIICPSNPFISIDPILSIREISDFLRCDSGPIAVVSPVIGGRAIKGPTANMMKERGLPVAAVAVARHYADLLPDLLVVDPAEVESGRAYAEGIRPATMEVLGTPILMTTLAEKENLARRILESMDGL